MSLKTKLTELFNIAHPIILAPMSPASGAALAEGVAAAGGLGLIGGGYAERAWMDRETALATRDDLGCGFITWALRDNVDLLHRALTSFPKALMLSFSDPAPYAQIVKSTGVPLICQVQSLEHVRRAIDCGADVIVAQGTEAGGHGFQSRSTLTLVPETVDLVAQLNADICVVAAGGIGDGRGLAAALMLGADGVLMGTRFWATQEALIHSNAKKKVVAASGDQTIRTRVYDIVRQKAWPAEYTGRLMRNGFIERWHGHEEELAEIQPDQLIRVTEAYDSGDYDVANVTVGECIGLIHDLPSAGEIVSRTVAEAEGQIARYSTQVSEGVVSVARKAALSA